MDKFLKRILKFFLLPIVIILFAFVGYFIFDPFKVLYSYDSYSHTHSNRDYYSIEVFNKRYPEQQYNSFIFGSSRTLGYKPSSWIKHLPSDARPFMLDGYGENIFGIYHKIKYLDSLNVDIKNVLVILDVDATLTTDEHQNDFFLFTKHPVISGESEWDFHMQQFRTYFNANMVLRYYLYQFAGLENDFIYHFLGNICASVDSVSNELTRDDLEEKIKTDENFFNRPIFYPRPEQERIVGDQIAGSILDKLNTISEIFCKHQTDYKIIIGPDYNQWKYNRNDMEQLEKIFGADRIYDFSGINYFTASKYNYYENSHYRPLVGDSIMNYIYNKHN